MSDISAQFLFDEVGVANNEGIQFWKDKTLLTPEEANKLETDHKNRAFYVAGLKEREDIESLYTALLQSLEKGETYADFKKKARTILNPENYPNHRLENIFRTNVFSAYAAGRYVQMQKVKKLRPYWQYLATKDKRVRPSHEVLHGLVYEADHPFWQVNYPLNGFRCRCEVRTLSKRQVEKMGLKVETEMPQATLYIDPHTGMEYTVNFPGADNGFKNNVGMDWLAGLTPQEIDERDIKISPRINCSFFNKDSKNFSQNNCLIPLEQIAKKHILEINENDILPANLSDYSYEMAFLKEFNITTKGGSILYTCPKLLTRQFVISSALFTDKITGGSKVNKYGRGQYMKLLARTIQNPYEIWEDIATTSKGKQLLVTRFIRLFGTKDKAIGGFGVFSLYGTKWSGSTVFTPKTNNPPLMYEYLNKQRNGTLLYREA